MIDVLICDKIKSIGDLEEIIIVNIILSHLQGLICYALFHLHSIYVSILPHLLYYYT